MQVIWLFAVVMVMGIGSVFAGEETPLVVSVCDLKNNPDAYNHRLVQVQGRISHEFEDFSIRDDRCSDFINTPWLMYGGNAPNDVTYCCGVATGSKEKVNIEGVDVPLKNSPLVERLIRLLNSYRINKKAKIHYFQTDPSFSVTATLVGRFFAGKQAIRDGRGFGHMGCCTLLAIEQVASIDKVVSNIKPGELSCYTEGWTQAAGDENTLASKLNDIHKSDEPWQKKNPRRVATAALNSYLNSSNPTLKFKGCKTKHLTYDDKENDQYLATCQWISPPSDSFTVEVMKYSFLKNTSNTWNEIPWIPNQISHQHCSEQPYP